jgi:peptide/nickel transport system ATP-binding protein
MEDRHSPVLETKDLRVYYRTEQGPVKAVDGVTFDVNWDERFGLVGESGCGKSTMVTSFLRLIKPPGVIESGEIVLDGMNILDLGKEEMRMLRWSKVSLIPQGAMNSLNPVMRVREQIADGILAHENLTDGEIDTRIRELLRMVELPARVINLYPHELSGGMKQRVCIAMATSLQPQLIVADEPTSALDVVVQRAVMQTLIEVQERLGASLILVGHDMGLEAQVVDRLAVMYAGRISEIGDVHQVFSESLHPYTQLLISSLPSPRERRVRKAISGLPPNLLDPPSGCLFHPRCPQVMDKCRQERPELCEIRPGHFVACHLYRER